MLAYHCVLGFKDSFSFLFNAGSPKYLESTWVLLLKHFKDYMLMNAEEMWEPILCLSKLTNLTRMQFPLSGTYQLQQSSCISSPKAIKLLHIFKKPPNPVKLIYLDSFKHIWEFLKSKSIAWVIPDSSFTHQPPWHDIHCLQWKSSFNHCGEHITAGHCVASFLGGASSSLIPIHVPWMRLYVYPQVWSMCPLSKPISPFHFFSHSSWFRDIG